MENKKHIALVTTWFPPNQSVATNRMIAFASFLSDDFEITVFSLDQKNHEEIWQEQVRVVYIKSASIFDFLADKTSDSKWIHYAKTASRIVLSKMIKNPLKSWQKGVSTSLIKKHAEHPFDLVISSYAPQETHLAVLTFVKKHQEVKWIADMRDEMSKNPGLNAKQQAHLHKIEKEINLYADAITTVSEPILRDFKDLCPQIKFFEEVRNGFNHELPIADKPKNNVFTLGYFGSFYGGRKPVTFFKALQELCQKRTDFDFKFVVVGAHRNFDIPSIFHDKVDFREGLSYQKAVELMMKMDLNIVIHPRSDQKGVFTGKLFDYVSVKKPVLACVDKNDVAAKLVLDFGAGYVAECDDLSENVKALERAFDDWKNNLILVASEENRLSLHRKNQVKKLNRLIQQLVS
ncbi:MAG TPA: hypothetical protein PLI97_01340 [Fluviicola sp.]|nr:hypothetical protein [Fluviicola sp.]